MTATEHLDAIYREFGFQTEMAAPLTLDQVRLAAVLRDLRETGSARETATNLGIGHATVSFMRANLLKVTRTINSTPIAALVLLLPLISFAQIKGSALLIPSVAPTALKTNRQTLLQWDSSESKFNIYTGTNRASLQKTATISSNSYPVQPQKVYGITAINIVGLESTMAYWRSNRVGALVEQSSVDLKAWRDERTLETFTNTPATPRMFLRIVDTTKGWLPPD